MSSGFVIQYRQLGESWNEIALGDGDIIVGRGQDCDLRIDYEGISRHHLKLSKSGEAVWVTDLGSTNGTKIDGVRIQANMQVPLRIGQLVEIGNAKLQVQEAQQPMSIPVQATPHVVSPPQTRVEPVQMPRASSPPPKTNFSGYNLRYQLRNGPWMEFPLPKGEVIIGRYIEADLYLDDDAVSRRHARITISDETVFLQDLGSTNGTLVDGQPLSPRRQTIIQPGQVITIGAFVLDVRKVQPSDMEPATMMGEMGDYMSHDDKVAVMGSRVDLRALNFQKMDRITVGRASDNDVVLSHPLVSRYHALIEKMGGRFRLRDLESTNGVFVNGVRIKKESWLTEGDTITIGASDFVLAGMNLQRQVETGLKLDAQHINQFVSKELNLLQDISILIKPMEFVALVGMSGAGKSTLLNAMSGYWPASQGQVLVNGVNLYDHYDFFRNDIGYVPQKDIVHSELTPASALDYVARLRLPPDTTSVERKALVDDVLEDLDLTERRDVPIHKLSGGQLKRVSIGVELLTKPRLFYLDEPTSGLDPGTEYEMMKLLRRLADQGRTITLVTHATKNVMLCDKVIFLARGGHLAFYGAPEKGLEYFDQFRTDRERREKAMEFDDIYIILNDEKRGRPVDWGKRYRESSIYQKLMSEQQASAAAQQPGMRPAAKRGKSKVSSIRQFVILSSRNLKILFQDKVSLALMLAIAPAIGMMDFIWGSNLFDPVEGDASKIITMWFMSSLITVLVGAISSVREIVKEVDIYKRERAVNLKIGPYVLSKVWVGLVLALYQAGMLLFFKILFSRPDLPSFFSFLGLYITLFLGTMCGYFVGLAISAISPNENSAMLLIIVALVPQFLFAGALLPLDLIPGGEAISLIMPTRWGFETFLRISGMGDQLAEDPCWLLDEDSRKHLNSEMKAACPCMGESIFTECAEFPGILSPDFFDEIAQAALVSSKPVEPDMPTAYPSLTPLPTPTRLASLTPYPTPDDPREMEDYYKDREDQGEEYQDSIMDQMEVYRVDSQDQGMLYSDMRNAQGDEYTVLMRSYGDDRADWQESREKAISSAEGLLESIYDNFGRGFSGSVPGRWMIMSGLMIMFIIIVFIAQKRKDVV